MIKFCYLITGYIISRVKLNDQVCEKCFVDVCVEKPLKTTYSTFVNLKEFKTGSLQHPSELTFNFFLCMENIFRKYRSLVLHNREEFQKMLDAAISSFTFPDCHYVKKRLMRRFIEFRCKNVGCFLNKRLIKLKKKRWSIT